MWSVRKRVVATVAVLTLTASSAAADTLRVPRQFDTIGEALAVAATGDRVLVAPGTYRENVVVDLDGVELVGRNAVWDGTVDGILGACVVVNGDANLIQGFTFRNCTTGAHTRGDGNSVSRCRARNAVENGFRMDGGEVGPAEANGATIDRCETSSTRNAGIFVHGNAVRVAKCNVRRSGGNGIEIDGDGFVADRNRIANVAGAGVDLDGDDATLSRNQIRNVASDGIRVSGSGATVSRNRVVNGGATGLLLVGDVSTAIANRVNVVVDAGISATGQELQIGDNRIVDVLAGDGIVLQESVDDSGCVVTGNRVMDVSGSGILLEMVGGLASRNVVSGVGFECGIGISVVGATNVITDCLTDDLHGVGFLVAGDGNQLFDCVARGCSQDGFSVLSGNANLLERCTASGCEAQGLSNFATLTTVRESRFTKNRLDVASETEFDSFFGTLSQGGPGAPVEIFNCFVR